MKSHDWLMLIGATGGIAGAVIILFGFLWQDLLLATDGAKVLLAGFLFALTGICLWLFDMATKGGGHNGW